jgi:hypothetical protein
VRAPRIHDYMSGLRGGAKCIVIDRLPRDDGECDQRLRVTKSHTDRQCPSKSRDTWCSGLLLCQPASIITNECHLEQNCIGPQPVRSRHPGAMNKPLARAAVSRIPEEGHVCVQSSARDVSGRCIVVQLSKSPANRRDTRTDVCPAYDRNEDVALQEKDT